MLDIADWATTIEGPQARPLGELVGEREHVVVDPPERAGAARACRQAQEQKDQAEERNQDGRNEAQNADAHGTWAMTHGLAGSKA
jgi:hypothetical protein